MKCVESSVMESFDRLAEYAITRRRSLSEEYSYRIRAPLSCRTATIISFQEFTLFNELWSV